MAGDFSGNKCLLERSDTAQIAVQPLQYRAGDAEFRVFRLQPLQTEARHRHLEILRHIGVPHHLGGQPLAKIAAQQRHVEAIAFRHILN